MLRLAGVQAPNVTAVLTKLNASVAQRKKLGLCVRWTWVEFLLWHLLTERPWGSHLIPPSLIHKIGMIRSTLQDGCGYWMH